MYIYIYMYMYIHIYIYKYKYICTYICIYGYIHIYVYVHNRIQECFDTPSTSSSSASVHMHIYTYIFSPERSHGGCSTRVYVLVTSVYVYTYIFVRIYSSRAVCANWGARAVDVRQEYMCSWLVYMCIHTADCRKNGTESWDYFKNVFNEPDFCPWDSRLVPRNNVVLMINPVNIQVRLVLNGKFFRNNLKILCHPICNRL